MIRKDSSWSEYEDIQKLCKSFGLPNRTLSVKLSKLIFKSIIIRLKNLHDMIGLYSGESQEKKNSSYPVAMNVYKKE